MTTALPTSFSSLPEDIVLIFLSRVSLFHHPTLSLVSKYLRSLIASPELEATRSRNGTLKQDDLYVFFDLHGSGRWFKFSPFPTQLKPLPQLTYYEHPHSSTVLSVGSEIYIIGGLVGLYHRKKGNRALVLDCQSHEWRNLPRMSQCRKNPAACVIDGKIYVIGGCTSYKTENWGEVYDLNTQTWEPLSPATVLDLTARYSVVPGKLVMGGKVYDMNMDHGLKLDLKTNVCVVEIENMMCQISISDGMLVWCDLEENLESSSKKVEGLQGVPRGSYWVASYDRGRRVTVWWKLVKPPPTWDSPWREGKTEIWCAGVSFERRDVQRLWGCVEWSKNVLILDGSYSSSDFFLYSAIVTY